VCTTPQYLTEERSGLQHSDEHCYFKSGDHLSLVPGVASAELYTVTVLNTVELSNVHTGRFQTPSTLHGVYFVGLMITTGVTLRLNRCGVTTEWTNRYCSASLSQILKLPTLATSKSNVISVTEFLCASDWRYFTTTKKSAVCRWGDAYPSSPPWIRHCLCLSCRGISSTAVGQNEKHWPDRHCISYSWCSVWTYCATGSRLAVVQKVVESTAGIPVVHPNCVTLVK